MGGVVGATSGYTRTCARQPGPATGKGRLFLQGRIAAPAFLSCLHVVQLWFAWTRTQTRMPVQWHVLCAYAAGPVTHRCTTPNGKPPTSPKACSLRELAFMAVSLSCPRHLLRPLCYTTCLLTCCLSAATAPLPTHPHRGPLAPLPVQCLPWIQIQFNPTFPGLTPSSLYLLTLGSSAALMCPLLPCLHFDTDSLSSDPNVNHAAAAAKRKLIHSLATEAMDVVRWMNDLDPLIATLSACASVGYGWGGDSTGGGKGDGRGVGGCCHGRWARGGCEDSSTGRGRGRGGGDRGRGCVRGGGATGGNGPVADGLGRGDHRPDAQGHTR